MKIAVAAIRAGETAALEGALNLDPKLAKSPQLCVDAARVANRAALRLLLRRGADLNAAWRGYRPLHSLIQERLHDESSGPSKERLACLDWLLERGADPELTGAWPPARAVLVAAFAGSAPLVERLIYAKCKVDGFVACALGDVKRVERTLASDPKFARARDGGGLTALQCCAASGMGTSDAKVRQRLLAIAGKLLDAGADPNARTKSPTSRPRRRSARCSSSCSPAAPTRRPRCPRRCGARTTRSARSRSSTAPPSTARCTSRSRCSTT
jgi:hypothetical protein